MSIHEHKPMLDATHNLYEVTVILPGATSEADVAKAKDTLEKHVTAAGGSADKHELWGVRELAYRIKGNTHGIYLTIWASIPSQALSSFEREIILDEGIIRHLVTKAYTTAQPGSLYPVKEEDEKREKRTPGAKRTEGEAASAEEELRRSAAPKRSKRDAVAVEEESEISEEERQEKLDAALDALLGDDASTSESASESEEATTK